MGDSLCQEMENWDIPLNQIIAMCFDTTASNTGEHEGACKHYFEDTIARAVLWLACRHHIGELHIKHVDIRIRGPWEDSFKTNSTKIISPD